MENISSLIDLFRPNDFIATIYLKDAYFTVPIHADHSKFLRFRWNGLLYEFIVLPFGLASAPRVFTKLMNLLFYRLVSHLLLVCSLSL
jgi:hypothetical protein